MKKEARSDPRCAFKTMPLIRLINPNTSQATTRMMTSIARSTLDSFFDLEGVTATDGVPMILDAMQLAASEQGVVDMAVVDKNRLSGIIIGAFGDPAIDLVRKRVNCPVVGLCEASMLEASAGARKFGIATVTPRLVESFGAKADSLQLAHLFTGTRLTAGDPERLVASKERLEEALFHAVQECFEKDGADAVIIGGGPLGQVAFTLANRFRQPVIAPIPAAIRLLVQRMKDWTVDQT
ncbi:Asp/Glu/hydantoin racemase [Rhizobium skierniewicense]|uniref:Asp/Glu/hydantoin racemase n=1 Tax=Rhizobium skierniewicense TaxID=984260 RepID=A0A7W6C7I3_9HYPH|nr:aspartate/glutamate racemase family protein [Rhizobium skierniewicense]MBB3944249.1 Asp/Glu/hydantoin racemase [Rhizobium skierniewicense]